MRAAVVVFALSATACLVAHLAILRSVLRSASRIPDAHGGSGSAPVETGVPRPRIGIEVVWAIIPILALALVLTATWARVQSNRAPHPESIMEVAR